MDIKKIEPITSIIYYTHIEAMKVSAFSFIPSCVICGKESMIELYEPGNIIGLGDGYSDFESFLRLKWLSSSYVSIGLLRVLKDFFLIEIKESSYIVIKQLVNTIELKIHLPNGNLATPYLEYYKHKTTGKQFFMLSTFFESRERTNDYPVRYIERLWQVEFDHDEFMRQMEV